VFLLTIQSSRQPDWERSVIGAAARAGVARLVKLSVFRADERSPLRFARQHWQAERALEQSGLAWTIVRPVFLMQNLRAMVRGGAIYTAAGDGRVATIDARDIAAVAAAALTTPGHEGKIYTLTGPEALSFDDIASDLSQLCGKHIRHVRVSVDDACAPRWSRRVWRPGSPTTWRGSTPCWLPGTRILSPTTCVRSRVTQRARLRSSRATLAALEPAPIRPRLERPSSNAPAEPHAPRPADDGSERSLTRRVNVSWSSCTRLGCESQPRR
jgi:hypothetical protein